MITWLLIGLGSWLGLTVPKSGHIFADGWQAVAIGFVLTVAFWPIALYNNRHTH